MKFKSSPIVFFLFFFLLLDLLGCKNGDDYKEIFSYPRFQGIDKEFNSDENITLLFTLTGDLSQQLYSQVELKDESSPVMMPSRIKVGGISYLSRYLKIIKSKLGNKSIVLSLGNNLPEKGGQDSSSSKLAKILPLLDIDIYHYGFNESLYLKDKDLFNSLNIEWLNTNIFSIKKAVPLDLWGAHPYILKEIEGVKIGFMGVTSFHTLKKSQKKLLNGQYFQDPLISILKTRALLEKEGANIIVLLYEGESDCQKSMIEAPKNLDSLDEAKCLLEDEHELYNLVEKLPLGTVDLIFAKGSHFSIREIKRTPLLGIPNAKRFLTSLKISIRRKDYSLDKEKSYILQPLKLCHHVFAELEDCVLSLKNEEKNKRRFEFLENTGFGLMPAKFLDHQISPDQKIIDIINDK